MREDAVGVAIVAGKEDGPMRCELLVVGHDRPVVGGEEARPGARRNLAVDRVAVRVSRQVEGDEALARLPLADKRGALEVLPKSGLVRYHFLRMCLVYDISIKSP